MPRGRPKAREEPVETPNDSELNYSDQAPEEDILNEEPVAESTNQDAGAINESIPEGDERYEKQGEQQSYYKSNEEEGHSYTGSYGEQRGNNRDNQGYFRKTAPENSVIAIFNLNDNTTESDIRTLTEPFGEVEHVNMIYNHNTDVFRGFCFVRFASLDSARDAHKSLEGKSVKGNEIRVDFCKDRERRPMRGGGFRRDRGYGDGYYGKPKRNDYRGYDDRYEPRRDDRGDRYDRGGRRDDSYGRRERRYDDRDDRRNRYDRDDRREDRRYDRGYRNDSYGSRGGRDESRYTDRDNRPRNGYESRYGRGDDRDRRH